jgi:hypothetical protein
MMISAPQNPLAVWANRFESRTFKMIGDWCGGRNWQLVTVLSATLLSLFYAWPPYDTLATIPPQWAAREEHIAQPFRDPAAAYDSRSNEAKRTFRLTVPLLAHTLRLNRFGVILLLHLSGVLVYLGCVVAAYRITHDRVSAFLCTLTTAVIPTGALAFWDFNIFFYDAVALAAVTAAIACRSPLAVFLLVLAASWTDERGLVASSMVFLYHLYNSTQSTDNRPKMTGVLCALAVTIAWLTYFVGRMYLRNRFAFQTETGDVGLAVMASQINLISISAWGALEGLWLILCAAIIILWSNRNFGFAFLLGGAITASSIIACSVFDLTRSFAYLYPVLFISLRTLQDNVPLHVIQRLLLITFIISLVWLNLFVTGPRSIYLMKPLPFHVLVIQER